MFVCFVLTLKVVMSGEVNNRWCSRLLTVSRDVRRGWTTSREVRRVGSRAGMFMEAYEIPITMNEYVLILYKL